MESMTAQRAIGIAWPIIILLAVLTQFADAGSRKTILGGDIEWNPQTNQIEALNDANHYTAGLRPRCVGPNLQVRLTPSSDVAPWVSLTPDGALLRRDIAAGVTAGHGTDILINFTQHGEPITCRDVFFDHAGNNLKFIIVQNR